MKVININVILSNLYINGVEIKNIIFKKNHTQTILIIEIIIYLNDLQIIFIILITTSFLGRSKGAEGRVARVCAV